MVDPILDEENESKISKVKSKYRTSTKKYGVRITKSVKEAIVIENIMAIHYGVRIYSRR